MKLLVALNLSRDQLNNLDKIIQLKGSSIGELVSEIVASYLQSQSSDNVSEIQT